VALLADVEAIGIAEIWSEPGAPAAPLHVHRRHVESLYVLEGEIDFTIADRELRAGPGSWVQVPTGAPHALAFPGEDPVRFLDLHTPSCGFGAFLRAVHGAGGGQASPSAPADFDQEAV
jgi:mannose-6-phosphate isomerase-like protein (cupin superfamily)